MHNVLSYYAQKGQAVCTRVLCKKITYVIRVYVDSGTILPRKKPELCTFVMSTIRVSVQKTYIFISLIRDAFYANADACSC